MKKLSTKSDVEYFLTQLRVYKNQIDSEISDYSKQVQKSTLQHYGNHSRVATDAYLEILNRGGKRIRGALAMTGYYMSGGTDHQMILKAARSLEMIHAYLLIMDDIQDRSVSRRGGTTAHVALGEYHNQKNLSGNSEHFGVSIALNAMGIGNHAAQVTIANLEVAEELRLKALSILNQSVIITAHGQTSDIMNEVNGEVTMRDVDNVLQWKTAHYTFLNPLTFGQVLAGADCQATDAIREYALSAGRAFQITDDILGIFGSERASGKSSLDDIREGKRTILTLYALKHAEKADRHFLMQMLGNSELSQSEFEQCKSIIVESGALAYTQSEAEKSVQKAVYSIEHSSQNWPPEQNSFLRGLAQYLLTRTA